MSGSRALGRRDPGIRRLIYEHTTNKERIQRAIINAQDSLDHAFPHDAARRFYLICSLSGGTGSGMFLPLADDMLKWGVFTRDIANQNCGPSWSYPGYHHRPPRSLSRQAFASLKELNYRAVEQRMPFSGTYLIEPVNETGHVIGLETFPSDRTASVLSIQGGEAAQKIAGLMDNKNLGDLDNDGGARRRPRFMLSTFGLSSISYPREVIARAVSLRWASGVISIGCRRGTRPKT